MSNLYNLKSNMTYFIQIFFCILLFRMIPFVTDFFDDNLKNAKC